jgi:glycine/D-amino acid oxidase-like deaminating enzyme
VIGADPVAKGFFWLAGQGGYGFLTSPAASQLAADLILGRSPHLETDIRAALSPERFTR